MITLGFWYWFALIYPWICVIVIMISCLGILRLKHKKGGGP